MNVKNKPAASQTSAPTTDQIERLIDEVVALSQEVRVLRDAIDDLRVDYRWATQNAVGDQRYYPVMHISSMPKDACAPDFGERINRFGPGDLPAESEAVDASQSASRQGELW